MISMAMCDNNGTDIFLKYTILLQQFIPLFKFTYEELGGSIIMPLRIKIITFRWPIKCNQNNCQMGRIHESFPALSPRIQADWTFNPTHYGSVLFSSISPAKYLGRLALPKSDSKLLFQLSLYVKMLPSYTFIAGSSIWFLKEVNNIFSS